MQLSKEFMTGHWQLLIKQFEGLTLKLKGKVDFSVRMKAAFAMSTCIALSSCVQTSHADDESAAVNNPSMTVDDLNPPPRLNISEVSEDSDMLASLRTAVAVMRKNGNAAPDSVEFVNSLQFWANTHGFIGNQEQDPLATDFLYTVVRRSGSCVDAYEGFLGSETDAISTCTGIYRQVDTPFQTDEFTADIWGTCQHTAYSPPSYAVTPRFLPWHRLYLYYFDRTLRKVSGNDELALPYWDYFDYQVAATVVNTDKDTMETSPNTDMSTNHITLPPVVTQQELDSTSGGQPNSLYDQLRSYGLNDGDTSITPDNASAKDAFAFTEFVDFSNAFEGQPHGAMHCAIGDGCSIPHMGWVPLAGNDPIFYMHHANIDRLWQCWLNEKAQGEEITLEWAKENLGMPDWWYDISYYFADENGNKVQNTIADAFSPEVLAVRYSKETDCQLDIDGNTSSQVATIARAALTESLELDFKPQVYSSQKVTLQPHDVDVVFDNALAESLSTQSLMTKYEGKSGIWVILENVVVNEAPYYNFNVMVSNKNAPDKQVSIGVFDFFGFGGNHGAHAGHHESGIAENSLGNLDYYITDDLSELGFTNIDEVLVTIKPQPYTSGAKINQNRINLIEIDAVHVVTIP